MNNVSLWGKVRFVVYDESHPKELISDIDDYVTTLYGDSLPPDEMQAESGREEVSSLLAVFRELEVVVKDRDPTLQSALNQILHQQVGEY